MTKVSIGSRGSRLALWQTQRVITLLKQKNPSLQAEVITIMTKGDQDLERSLQNFGSKGAFTFELEEALREGKIDFAVHSLKDFPTEDTPGLKLGAVCDREQTNDVLIAAKYPSLEGLPHQAVVGTSSPRREFQLRQVRPDLVIKPIRGNVETRIQKVHQGEFDAIVLAYAGVSRLERLDEVREVLPFATMLPAPGQGALAIQCREDDEKIHLLLQDIHEPYLAKAVAMERGILSQLQLGCAAAVGAFANCSKDHASLWARMLLPSHTAAFETNITAPTPDEVMHTFFQELHRYQHTEP